MTQILFVAQSQECCSVVESLAAYGFEVTVQIHAENLNGEVRESDLVILDSARPLVSNEILRAIRHSYSNKPTIVLSPTHDVIECVTSLELGADDYFAISLDASEIVARMNALLRRCLRSHEVPQSQVGDIVIRPKSRTVFQDGCPVELTTLEFDVLSCLLNAAVSVVTRKTLSQEVFDGRLCSESRVIDIHVSRLRRKLGRKRGCVERICTIRGQGYMYCVD